MDGDSQATARVIADTLVTEHCEASGLERSPSLVHRIAVAIQAARHAAWEEGCEHALAHDALAGVDLSSRQLALIYDANPYRARGC